jgi:hypothetical protein
MYIHMLLPHVYVYFSVDVATLNMQAGPKSKTLRYQRLGIAIGGAGTRVHLLSVIAPCVVGNAMDSSVQDILDGGAGAMQGGRVFITL